MRCRPGSIRGFDDIRPPSLRKARIDPGIRQQRLSGWRRTGESDSSNQDSQVRSRKMQGGEMLGCGAKDTSRRGHDSRQTDHAMKRSDGLGKLHRRYSSPDRQTKTTASNDQHAELAHLFRSKSNCRECRHDSRKYPKHTESVSRASCSLRQSAYDALAAPERLPAKINQLKLRY